MVYGIKYNNQSFKKVTDKCINCNTVNQFLGANGSQAPPRFLKRKKTYVQYAP